MTWTRLAITAGEHALGIAPASVATAAATGFVLINGKLAATVDANILTVSLKLPDDTDPDPYQPVFIGFRDQFGQADTIWVRGSQPFAISEGSKVGTVDDLPFRLWVLAILTVDGGVVLGVTKCTDVNGFTVYPLNEADTISTTAEGGAGGADDAGVIYSAEAMTDRPFRVLGCLEFDNGLPTAGEWSAPPYRIVLHGIGMPKPGDVVQEIPYVNYSSISSATTTIPFDNSAPQSSEGGALGSWAVTIEPTSKINHLEYEADLAVSHDTASRHVIAAVFRDAEQFALAANACKIEQANDLGKVSIRARFLPGDLAERTYAIRAGGSGAGRWTVNGVNAGQWFGGVLWSTATVRERMT